MKPTSQILCLGEAMVEFVRQPDGITFRQGFGGDTSNAAIAAARQGASTAYVSAVGKDRFGADLLALWQSENVDTGYVRESSDAPTGIYFIDPDPVARQFTYYRAGSAASRMVPDDLNMRGLAASEILHLSGITLAVSADLRRTADAAMQHCAANGVAVSLDTNYRKQLWPADRAAAVLADAMRWARIVFTSIDDQMTLSGQDDPARIARRIHGLGPEIVVITMGGEGAHLSVAGNGQHVPAAPCNPVDSTGAGDTFAGAFLAWWQETGDPVAAARLAGIAAAGTVSGYGAIDAIPTRGRVLDTATQLGLSVPEY